MDFNIKIYHKLIIALSILFIEINKFKNKKNKKHFIKRCFDWSCWIRSIFCNKWFNSFCNYTFRISWIFAFNKEALSLSLYEPETMISLNIEKASS